MWYPNQHGPSISDFRDGTSAGQLIIFCLECAVSSGVGNSGGGRGLVVVSHIIGKVTDIAILRTQTM